MIPRMELIGRIVFLVFRSLHFASVIDCIAPSHVCRRKANQQKREGGREGGREGWRERERDSMRLI